MPVAEVPISQLREQLEKLRDLNGEEAYEKVRKNLVFQILRSSQGQEHGETFIKNAWPDLDIEALKKEAAAHEAGEGEHSDPLAAISDAFLQGATSKEGADEGVSDTDPAPAPVSESAAEGLPADQLMLQAIQMLMPGLKTQGQLNIFMLAFEALRDTINAAFDRNEAQVAKGREALAKAINAAVKSAEMTERLKEIPEDQRSAEANAFVEPPKAFHEYDYQKRFLGELKTLTTKAALQKWYDTNRKDLDRVVSNNLRNELFDAIRTRRSELEAKEAN